MRSSRRYGVAALVLLYVLAPFHNWTVLYIAGLPLARLDFLAALTVLLAGGLTLVTSRRVSVNQISLLAVMLLGIATLSSLYATVQSPTSPMPIATMVPQFVILILVVLITSQLVAHVRDVVILLRTWLFTAAAISLFGVYQGFARVLSLPFARLVFNVPEPGTIQRAGYPEAFGPLFRISSIFPEPSWYGVYLVPPTVCCLSLLAHRPGGVVFKTKTRAATIAGILVVGVVQSASLLTYLTFIVTVCVFTIPIGVSRGRIRAWHVTSAIAGGLLVFFLSESAREALRRILHLIADTVAVFAGQSSMVSVGSASLRMKIAIATFSTWRDGTPEQEVIGLGLNALDRTARWTSASSSYLQMLVDTGLVGLCLFGALIAVSGLKTYRFSNSTAIPPGYRKLGIALTGSVIATAVQFVQIGYLYPVRWLGILAAIFYVSTNQTVLSTKASADVESNSQSFQNLD